MNYLSTSCLFLFFLFSLFHPLPRASSKQDLGWCEAQFQCGNMTAGFPFWGGNSPKVCGHPLLELHCFNNNTPSLKISNQEFTVFHINQTSNTLTLARNDLLGPFCSSTFTNTTLPSDIFDISPNYKSLTVFYHCNSSLPHLCSYKGPDKGLKSVSENHEDHETCASFTVNVPTGFVLGEKDFGMITLESVLRKGIEVKVRIDEKACEECLFSHELCGFSESSPLGVTCGPLHPPTDEPEKKGKKGKKGKKRRK